MATNPAGGTKNQGLTNYAFGIAQDYKALMADANFLAPPVTTGASVINYAKFDDKMAFLAYDARRSIGGARTRIKFAGENVDVTLGPLGLEIPLDDEEVNRVGGDRILIEQAKTRTLLSTWALSGFKRVADVAVTSGNYTAATGTNTGVWSDPNVDPVADIDAQILAVFNASGVMPNRMLIDLASWAKLRNHPKVIARQPGAAIVGATPSQMSAMLLVPLEIRIASGSIGTTGFGSATKTKASVINGKALVFFAQDAATQYDPSALKRFIVSEQGFEAIKQYREDSTNSDIFYLDGSEKVASISSLLLVLMSIT